MSDTAVWHTLTMACAASRRSCGGRLWKAWDDESKSRTAPRTTGDGVAISWASAATSGDLCRGSGWTGLLLWIGLTLLDRQTRAQPVHRSRNHGVIEPHQRSTGVAQLVDRLGQPRQDSQAGFAARYVGSRVFRWHAVALQDCLNRTPHRVSTEGMFDLGVLEDIGRSADRRKNVGGGKRALARGVVQQVLAQLLREDADFRLLQRIAGTGPQHPLIEFVQRLAQVDHEVVEVGVEQALEQVTPLFGGEAFIAMTPELHQLRGGGAQIHVNAPVYSQLGQQFRGWQQG